MFNGSVLVNTTSSTPFDMCKFQRPAIRILPAEEFLEYVSKIIFRQFFFLLSSCSFLVDDQTSFKQFFVDIRMNRSSGNVYDRLKITR